jgi:hypothetical protein
VAGVSASKTTSGSKAGMPTTQAGFNFGGVLCAHLLFGTLNSTTCALDIDFGTEFGAIAEQCDHVV